MNPVARLSTFDYGEGRIKERVITFCPGCKNAHAFTVKDESGEGPVWEWDGNLESPTFSPSLLCHYSYNTCGDEHTAEVCDDHENCDQRTHKIVNYYDTKDESEWVYAHLTPCTHNDPWGSCHSFLRNGVWEFLSDSAHPLAGQNVPMVPLPNYLVGHDF